MTQFKHYSRANRGITARLRSLHDGLSDHSFPLLRHFYSTRDDARNNIVDYIDMFYNSKRRYSFNNLMSPVQYEKEFKERLVSV